MDGYRRRSDRALRLPPSARLWRILEEHDNIPGFRERDVRILCGKGRAEWRFAYGRSVRHWVWSPS